ncbi:Uncharacterized [Moorella glycerini]|uniref:Uncharacterized protein n=1 Tax=Neomoorella stamsii TaxID=1266720 RepID=A0A9X7P772_9FIRM|nr:hypothetical protein MOST_04900 [Moorella stamsii]CEP67103.1 Uncharacterized [Moorella glycerini]
MEIKNRFGTITVHMPSRPPTPEEERRLYAVLVECLIERKAAPENGPNSRENQAEQAVAV